MKLKYTLVITAEVAGKTIEIARRPIPQELIKEAASTKIRESIEGVRGWFSQKTGSIWA